MYLSLLPCKAQYFQRDENLYLFRNGGFTSHLFNNLGVTYACKKLFKKAHWTFILITTWKINPSLSFFVPNFATLRAGKIYTELLTSDFFPTKMEKKSIRNFFCFTKGCPLEREMNLFCWVKKKPLFQNMSVSLLF